MVNRKTLSDTPTAHKGNTHLTETFFPLSDSLQFNTLSDHTE